MKSFLARTSTRRGKYRARVPGQTRKIGEEHEDVAAIAKVNLRLEKDCTFLPSWALPFYAAAVLHSCPFQEQPGPKKHTQTRANKNKGAVAGTGEFPASRIWDKSYGRFPRVCLE